MRQVYRIWFVKEVLPLLLAEFIVFVAILAGAQSYMSFQRIMQNISMRVSAHTVSSLWGYTIATVINTEFAALVFAVGALFVGAFIVRDASRAFRHVGGNILRFVRVI